MANPEHLAKLKEGVEAWNSWRHKTEMTWPDLRGADLSDSYLLGAALRNAKLSDSNLKGSDLRGANLSSADLRGAVLSHALLTSADLVGTDLSRAVLRGADLSVANFSGARLKNANLAGADLRDAVFPGADLTGANLFDANAEGTGFFETNFHRVDLRRVRRLTKSRLEGPSPLSPQTLEINQGKIPEVFLKGCGLKDWEILAARLHDPDLRQDEIIDLTYKIAEVRGSSPIVPLSVFVSYAHEDQGFAAKIEQRLDQDGIRFWRDVHHLVAGPLEAQVDRAIAINGAVLLILSKHSVESDWVRWEAERARALELQLEVESGERRHRLCPVALDDAWETCRWPGPLRSQIEDYTILDFSTWASDQNTFEAQYEKLKTGLGIYYRK